MIPLGGGYSLRSWCVPMKSWRSLMRWTMLSLISDGCDRYFSICPESCGYKPAGFVVFARAINVYVSIMIAKGCCPSLWVSC
jgi:hypothetical protein